MQYRNYLLVSVVFLLFSTIFLFSCSKPAKNTPAPTKVITIITPTVSPNAPPLANTVDRTDTINVMAYNVLNYGDGCQGDLSTLNGYLKTIVQYTRPDIFSCEKMKYFPPTSGYPANFAAVITNDVLNAVFPGRYDFATPTDVTFADAMSVLFYNKQKLTFVKTETLVANITDFDLYKLYYNDPNLNVTHDTTFLYVLVNHTQSGSSSAQRDQQVAQEMQNLRAKFTYLPNVINMGDFNTHSSFETAYQAVITSPDTSTQMVDPPFYPDKSVSYPGHWDNNTRAYSAFLTTSTRLSLNIPNSCGTSGGAFSWYDHIFISRWLMNGSNYIKYIPNSYQTIGNDGNRLGIDINSPAVVNTSAPDPVIQALWQFSNKYPVSIKLQVKANRNAYSLTDPPEKN
jgi:hypothetical protein